MGILRNRTLIGVLCIVISLIICFALTPLFNESISQKADIVRVTKEIMPGDLITKDMITTTEVGGHNLPPDVIRDAGLVVGQYAVAYLAVGDYILPTKLSDVPAAENAYLYNLNGEKQAISVTIKSFANGLSGKLMSGDIISIIAPDFQKLGETVIPPELVYVEVIGVTASSGYDANTGEGEPDDRELPSTVTLLVNEIQSKILAELEAEGRLHAVLVFRGDPETAALFIEEQDAAIEELYAEEEEDEDGEDGDGDGSGTQADSTDSQQAEGGAGEEEPAESEAS